MTLSRKQRKQQKFKRKHHKYFEEETKEEELKKKSNPVLEVYDKHYKKLLVIPFIILLIAIILIISKVAMTGDFINRGVSLKGGLSLTIQTDADAAMIDQYLQETFPGRDVVVRSLRTLGEHTGVTIDTSDIAEKEMIATLENKIDIIDYSAESTGPSLGASFFNQTLTAILIAFVFMGIVVFLYFKTFVPSIAVILAAVSDIIVTLAIINLLDIRLSTAGIAAFLMLIGYSVDTDILLSTRVLREKSGSIIKRVIGAMKTGLTMQVTTIVAVALGLIVSRSEVISQIMTIVLIGLLVDIINTWIQNVGIIRLYLERKTKKSER